MRLVVEIEIYLTELDLARLKPCILKNNLVIFLFVTFNCIYFMADFIFLKFNNDILVTKHKHFRKKMYSYQMHIQ